MLILSRKRDESIVISLQDGTQITLTVVEIRGDKVRIGIDAPTEIPVHRKEVFDAIKAELGREASQSKDDQEAGGCDA